MLRYLSPVELEATGWEKELSCEKEDWGERVESLFAGTRRSRLLDLQSSCWVRSWVSSQRACA